MTYELATRILANHCVQCRPSPKPDYISVRSEFVQHCFAGYEWEDVELTVPAVREFLGY